jgi:hypothetical protein
VNVKVVDDSHDGEPILKDAEDVADARSAELAKPWWKFWTKPQPREDKAHGR